MYPGARATINDELWERSVMNSEDEDNALYQVVVNHEEQYSIWPAGRAVPAGWSPIHQPGKKSDCLAYITGVWVDMRPLSLRRKTEKTGQGGQNG